MNDAQLFVIFFSVLSFGWLGFLAGRAWEVLEEENWHVPITGIFIVVSIVLFVCMAANLITLVGRNF